MLLNFYICHVFLHRLLRRNIIISFQVYLFSRFFFSLPYKRLLRKWQPITSVYSCQCIIFCRPIMSHFKSNGTKQGTRTTTVITEVQTIFRTNMHDISTLSSPQRKAFRLLSKFQGHKLTFIPLL